MKAIEKSSNLAAADYCAETSTLIVEFKNGTQYKYENVPAAVYEEFEKTFDGSQSAGKFFNVQIKNMPSEKVK